MPLSVLDITAGWAKDAVLISKLGCHVTAIENNSFVFHFVQESFHQRHFLCSRLKFNPRKQF